RSCRPTAPKSASPTNKPASSPPTAKLCNTCIRSAYQPAPNTPYAEPVKLHRRSPPPSEPPTGSCKELDGGGRIGVDLSLPSRDVPGRHRRQTAAVIEAAPTPMALPERPGGDPYHRPVAPAPHPVRGGT